MNEIIYNQLQLREIFHLEFLRALARKIKPENYILKCGSNLRFFFNSIRYSEDMDLDVAVIKVDALKEIVMKVLKARSFQDSLRPFGIEKIVPPNISIAKQTETTQRFKVHLLTVSGDDLFSKVEFSRRGFKDNSIVEPVSDAVLRGYRLPPLLCPHYSAEAAVFQKIEAIAARPAIQARDVFDLYVLIPQANLSFSPRRKSTGAGVFHYRMAPGLFERAKENVLEIGFEQFCDTVVRYLSPDDRLSYETARAWNEIKIGVSDFLKEIGKDDA